VDDLVDAAADLISVLPELRPLDRSTFNAGYEVWRAIAAVPAGERYRILEGLEPGSIRNLWKASVGRWGLTLVKGWPRVPWGGAGSVRVSGRRRGGVCVCVCAYACL
jgi:hypothetical protein